MPVSWRILLLLLMPLAGSCTDGNKSQCGTADVLPSEAKQNGLFIIGGKTVPPRMFPWVGYLAFGSPNSPKCTVSLISVKYVVTAAHCIDKQCPETTFVVFGIVSMKSTAKKYIYKALRFLRPKVQHIKVKGSGIGVKMRINDIALIELDEIVDISSSKGAINIICMPTRDMMIAGNLFLAGWGATDYDSLQASGVLKYMISKVLNKTSCKGFQSKFCVTGIKSKETPYRGDSGGPAMKLIDGKYYLFGVLHAKETSQKRFRVFYTNAFEFIDWLKRHPEKDTQESTTCKKN